jgi:MFS family permease
MAGSNVSESSISVRRHAVIYLAGLTISAFGSLASAATMPALLFNLGVSTAFIGFLIGSLRINAFLVNLFLGQIGDRYSPRRVMIFCELGAALGSFMIWLSWQRFGTHSLTAFFLANNFRVFFTALQSGSVQKYAKLFDQKMQWAGKMAIWLNGATNGVLLLAGLLAIYFFRHLSVELIVTVDFFTFLINGAFLLLLQAPDEDVIRPSPQTTVRVGENVARYYRQLPVLFVLDVVLSLALCGSNTLNVRLLESAPGLVPLMPAIFGGAAFLTSFLTGLNLRPNGKWLWISLSISLLAQGLSVPYPWLVLAISVIRNLCYWLIYQSISREFMQSTSSENYAAAAAGRSATTVAVLASGEFWVGLAHHIGIAYEMGWRAVIALMGLLVPKKANAN